MDPTIDISHSNHLDILKKCVLIRDIVDIQKELLYKYKKYDTNGDILEQGKVSCPILDVERAMEFMKAIQYKELFRIQDHCIVFANEKTELIVQLVNHKYIFIEMESECEHIDRKYQSIEEMKEDLCHYHLSIDPSDFFVKKAEMMLVETLGESS